MGEARRRGTCQERVQGAIEAGRAKDQSTMTNPNPHLGPMLVLRHWLVCGVRPVSTEKKGV